jgi:hypothetical protein
MPDKPDKRPLDERQRAMDDRLRRPSLAPFPSMMQ